MSDSAPSPPTRPSPEFLLGFRHDPPRAGRLAVEARTRHYARAGWVRPTPSLPAGHGTHHALVLRRGQWVACPQWPAPEGWQRGDRVAIRCEPDEAEAFAEYIVRLARWSPNLTEHPALGPCAVSPFSTEPSGTHRLWSLAACRVALPAAIRVEARHDLIGIRLAQVALGFGADTLSGPIESERMLPLAGVSRPDESTIASLLLLVEQAGLEPQLVVLEGEDGAPSEILDAGTEPISLDPNFDPEQA